MSKNLSARFTLAPNLYNRRAARAWFFPWIQLETAIILAILGYYLGVSFLNVTLWLIAVALCVIMQDLGRPYSRIIRVSYWLLGEVLSLPRWQFEPETDKLEVYNSHPPPPFWRYRYHMRWVGALCVLLLAWSAAVYQARFSASTNSSDAILAGNVIFTLLLLSFGLIPYGALIAGPMGYIPRLWKRTIQVGLGIIGLIIAPFCFQPLAGGNWSITLFSSLVIFLLYTAVFISQRLWAGRQALNEVVREVSLTFLRWPEASKKLDIIPRLIGGRFHHDRAFILLTDPNDPNYLTVEAQYGEYPHILGQRVPIEKSLTGKALQHKRPIVWNDVAHCPYYHQPHSDDDTKAEIAVPIMHNGIVHGILAVQSTRRNVYGPGDKHLLQTIADILGTAMAVDKRDFFFDQAVELLESLGRRPNMAHRSEREAFNQFAAFAQNVLGADLVVYFPLSLTGCPVQQPYVHGTLSKREEDGAPEFPLPNALLTTLIADWSPVFPNNAEATTHLREALWPDTVARTENINTLCFVPVGLPREPLGALFLNFRYPKHFDTRFKFTVLSLAQSLAKLTSQLRYRSILFDGFGRPEIGWHAIVARHGFKEGVTHLARAEHRRQHGGDPIDDCNLFPLFHKVDDFLNELLLVESAVPPNFWQDDLKQKLQAHKSSLPERDNSRRPNTLLDVSYEIERENPWVKLALYRTITEAMNNAVIHGDAANIEVEVQRNPESITAVIINNGEPLPGRAEKDKSKRGIYVLLSEMAERLGAETKIDIGPGNQGAIVEIKFPALPLDRGEKI